MKFRSKNLLVTGGCGFIGSNFIKYLFNKYENINVYNLDNLTYAAKIENTSSFENHSKYKFIKGDICDFKLVTSIFKKHKIDGVINFAAESHVDNSILNPNKFIKTNINGVFNLLNIAFKFWMKKPFVFRSEFKNARFHQISTDEVYGSIKQGSFTELSKYNPNSPYSASKASADMLVRSFNKTYGLNVVTTISSNNYGANQHDEKFIPQIINNLLSGDAIKVYGDGENIRDWIHVNDHCRAIEIVFNKSKEAQIFNVGANNELTNLELVDKIYNSIRKKKQISQNISFVQDRFGHDFRYSLNVKKINSQLNWKPELNLEDYLNSIN